MSLVVDELFVKGVVALAVSVVLVPFAVVTGMSDIVVVVALRSVADVVVVTLLKAGSMVTTSVSAEDSEEVSREVEFVMVEFVAIDDAVSMAVLVTVVLPTVSGDVMVALELVKVKLVTGPSVVASLDVVDVSISLAVGVISVGAVPDALASVVVLAYIVERLMTCIVVVLLKVVVAEPGSKVSVVVLETEFPVEVVALDKSTGGPQLTSDTTFPALGSATKRPSMS